MTNRTSCRSPLPLTALVVALLLCPGGPARADGMEFRVGAGGGVVTVAPDAGFSARGVGQLMAALDWKIFPTLRLGVRQDLLFTSYGYSHVSERAKLGEYGASKCSESSRACLDDFFSVLASTSLELSFSPLGWISLRAALGVSELFSDGLSNTEIPPLIDGLGLAAHASADFALLRGPVRIMLGAGFDWYGHLIMEPSRHSLAGIGYVAVAF